MPLELPGGHLYKYDNPDDAYQEALRRIKKAKAKSSTQLSLQQLGFTAVPPEVGHLVKLTELNFAANKLTAVPPEIAQLKKLKYFHLHYNQLTLVPPEIGQLTRLTHLNLKDNQLTVVPPEIGQLTGLTSLDLRNNQLTAVPIEVTQLTNLKELWLDGNPDLPIPPEIVAQKYNAQVILDYLRQQQYAPASPLNEAKLILVGQGSVGKTSLVKRLMGQGFDEAENQTEGINIETWSLDVDRLQQGVVPVALNIWGFGGQEIMHATHQFFLTKRSLYLLVLDARQGEDEGRIEYWLALINSFAPDAPALIVINKSDQHHLDINRRGLQEKYPAIKGFIRTSARDGTGLDALKTKIAAILAEMAHVDSAFPASWMQVKQTLTAMQVEHDYIPYTAYQELCQTNGVTDESSQHTLIRFLHDLGIVLNFDFEEDDDRVHDTNVLNPNGITEGIYALLNNKALQERRGLLRHNRLQAFLPAAAFPAATQRRFLREMMLKFELAFELPDRQRMLIPDLISKEQPDFAWNDADALQFAYQYTVLPHSILHRFMVRQHQRIDPDIRWHTGVMLHADGFTALVKADIKAAKITIAIIGDGDRRQFLYSLRLEFASIHETIQGTKPQEVVPIPGYPNAPSIPYQFLLELEADGIEKQRFIGVRETFNVKDLLNGVSTSAMRQAGLPSRSQLLADLRSGFNDGEFYGLLFELGINKNDIGGETITGQMRECIAYMERHNRVAELVAATRKKRPRMDV